MGWRFLSDMFVWRFKKIKDIRSMNDDFFDAHKRHWEDAQLLEGSGRFANADQLYGVSAECGLKRLMIIFGMEPDVPVADRVHADKVWDRFESYRSGHHQGANYPIPTENPFLDWNVNQRYAHRSNFDSARLANHRTGAELVRDLITKAIQDGLL